MKLTLKQLAGEDFSYSLLSQIENDKANPSMETLHKLAEKLDMAISDLLNPIDFDLFKNLLIINEKKFVMTYDRDPKVDLEIVESIERYINDFSFSYYEEARLCELYCMSSFYLSGKLNAQLMDQVLSYYRQSGAVQKSFKTELFMASGYFSKQEFNKCQDHLAELVARLKQEDYLLDPKTIIDTLFLKSLLDGALGNYEEALHCVEQCFELANKYAFYAQFNRLLQFRALLTIQIDDYKQVKPYLKKFKSYIEFTQNVYDEAHYMYTYLHVENRLHTASNVADEAIHYMRTYIEESLGTLSVIFNQELGYAYWKNKDYEKALQELIPFEIPSYIVHPLDKAAGLEILAIRASCFEIMGNRVAAVEEIVQCHQKIKEFPASTYKTHIEQIYKEIMKL